MPSSPPSALDRVRDLLRIHFGSEPPTKSTGIGTGTSAASAATCPSSNPLDLEECTTLKDWLAPRDSAALHRRTYRRLLVNRPEQPTILRVADRLDVGANLYLVDHLLGTIGLVHFVDPGPSATPGSSEGDAASLRSQIERHISQAAYLRHLLLEEARPDEPHGGALPYTVEVVFVPTANGVQSLLGSILQDVVRELSVLHAIGVSLLEGAIAAEAAPADRGTDPARFQAEASAMRRAFPWLLHATAAWFRPSQPAPEPAPGLPPWIPTIPALAPVAPESKQAVRVEKTSDFRRCTGGIPPGTAETPKPGLPDEFWLRHFRLRDTRRMRFDKRQRLHLVHGHNGSGKSSLVEAFELVTSGTIERIANSGQDCRTVVTNRSLLDEAQPGSTTDRSASVVLRYLRPKSIVPTPSLPAIDPTPRSVSLVWRLHEQGISRPLAPAAFPAAGAFRLDQGLIKLLTDRSSDERQAILLGTFFPQEYSLERERKEIADALEHSVARLPVRLHSQFRSTTGAFDENLARASVAWVENAEAPWDRVLGLLPLDPSQINALLPLLPRTFESAWRRTGKAPSWEPVREAATEMDHGLRDLAGRASELVNAIEKARAFLTAYRSVGAAASTHPDETVANPFRKWLELLATSDLLAREHDLLSAFEALEAPAADPKPSIPPTFPEDFVPFTFRSVAKQAGPDPARRKANLAEATKRRDRVRLQLLASREAVAMRTLGSKGPPPLESFDLGALDTLARAGVFGREYENAAPTLSQAVRSAFHGRAVVQVSGTGDNVLQLGEVGTFGKLLEQADKLAPVLQVLPSLLAEWETPIGGLSGILQQYQSIRSNLERQAKLRTEASERFRIRLTAAGPAINEFTAMLTPARWAYPDLVDIPALPTAAAAATPSAPTPESARLGPSRLAQLRLNTAQLSTFAMTFFLLCHRAREHPLRVAILDDPFENMDELTVTTVSRGLARYLRLRSELESASEAWHMILFVHGEQNAERIRRENTCATYRLPWLPPSARLGQEKVVVAEDSELRQGRLQDLRTAVGAAS